MKKILLLITLSLASAPAYASVIMPSSSAYCSLSFENTNGMFVATGVQSVSAEATVDQCIYKLERTGNKVGENIVNTSLNTGQSVTPETVFGSTMSGTISFNDGETGGMDGLTPALEVFTDTLVESTAVGSGNELDTKSSTSLETESEIESETAVKKDDEAELRTLRTTLIGLLQQLLSLLQMKNF